MTRKKAPMTKKQMMAKKAAVVRSQMARRREILREADTIASYRVCEYEHKVREEVQRFSQELQRQVAHNAHHKAVAIEAIMSFEKRVMALVAPPRRRELDDYGLPSTGRK